jgi:transcriptional regulator with XRE-family HTH domain
MTSTTTLLNGLIAIIYDGNAAPFCRKHGVAPSTISNLRNGTGNSTLSFATMEKYANVDGYTIGTVLHRFTGDMVADALAHVRAAAIEARNILCRLDELTVEESEQLALLNKIIDAR